MTSLSDLRRRLAEVEADATDARSVEVTLNERVIATGWSDDREEDIHGEVVEEEETTAITVGDAPQGEEMDTGDEAP